MNAITIHQPWAQLIVDRRRHVIIKTWTAEPGEMFAIHAAAYKGAKGKEAEFEAQCLGFGYESSKLPRKAILGIVEVVKCLERQEVRKSKFDVSNAKYEAKQYAIVVRTIKKFRDPKPAEGYPTKKIWYWEES